MGKVLVVDDTKNIRIMLTTCLELRGFEVLTAGSGHEALEKIKNEKSKLELAFLDIRMPEMNGTDVLRNIRNMGETCPVIIMTAFATVKNAVDCTKLGAEAYLQKPFSPDRVNAVIDEVYLKDKVKQQLPKNNSIDYLKEAEKDLEQGNFEKAHNNLKQALAKDPYDKKVYLLLSKLHTATNNDIEAQRFYNMYMLF